MIRCLLVLLVFCATMTGCHAGEAISRPERCQTHTFSGYAFTDCVIPSSHTAISIVLDGADHRPLRSLKRLSDAPGAQSIAFAMNGGMFDTAGKPIGLLIIDGKMIHPLNSAPGTGNFYLKPNGVFWLDRTGVHISASDDYLKSDGHAIKFATQSGPLLVKDGQLHPGISPDGTSRNIRNGVGIDRQGRVHFAISASPVSFGVFARYFRDGADCRTALYLDGFVSSLWDPASGRLDENAQLGPLIVVRN